MVTIQTNYDDAGADENSTLCANECLSYCICRWHHLAIGSNFTQVLGWGFVFLTSPVRLSVAELSSTLSQGACTLWRCVCVVIQSNIFHSRIKTSIDYSTIIKPPFATSRAASCDGPVHMFVSLFVTSDKWGGTCFARVCLSVCVFVCLSVSKFTQKRGHGFGWNVACRQMSGHGRTD